MTQFLRLYGILRNSVSRRFASGHDLEPALRLPKGADQLFTSVIPRSPHQATDLLFRLFQQPLYPAVLLLLLVRAPAQEQRQHSAAYRSMEQKIAYLQKNAARANSDPKPTEITQDEANAYFAEGGVKLPKGVTSLKLAALPGMLDAHAQVDFDVITQKARTSNPLLAIFTGVHDVHVIAQAAGTRGTGTITVQHLDLDNIEVPQLALQFFVDRYIKPKYPYVGTTSTFKLPLRIDTAAVEGGRVLVVQR